MRCRKGCALNNFFAFFAGVLIVVQQRRLARCQRYAGLGLTLAGQDVEHIDTSGGDGVEVKGVRVAFGSKEAVEAAKALFDRVETL